jgi:hypothetical protein
MEQLREDNNVLRKRAAVAETIVLQQAPAPGASDVHSGESVAEVDDGEAFEAPASGF